MGLKSFCLKKSLWVFHFAGASCNNCDIEILDVLTPRYDVERFGMQLIAVPGTLMLFWLADQLTNAINPV